MSESAGMGHEGGSLAAELSDRFGKAIVIAEEQTADGIPTLWLESVQLFEVLGHLKTGIERPFAMLYDLTAVDERTRRGREDWPAHRRDAGFTAVYQLLSFERDRDIRLKVALDAEDPVLRASAPSIPTRIGTSARSGTCSASASRAVRTSSAS
jgi:NADH-quinone oxidoreductase subunit C/D